MARHGFNQFLDILNKSLSGINLNDVSFEATGSQIVMWLHCAQQNQCNDDTCNRAQSGMDTAYGAGVVVVKATTEAP